MQGVAVTNGAGSGSSESGVYGSYRPIHHHQHKQEDTVVVAAVLARPVPLTTLPPTADGPRALLWKKQQQQVLAMKNVRRYNLEDNINETRRRRNKRQHACALTALSSVSSASDSQRWCEVMREVCTVYMYVMRILG